jgi:predicted PhzF superfamily epimerase YddE/YHI9
VFVDDPEQGVMRIFTPRAELALAGHPLVGTAWLLREMGRDVKRLRPSAGEVGVRFDGELTHVTARPEWGPPWEFDQLGSPAEVDALTPHDQRNELVRWAWLDEDKGIVRLRAFARDDGIPEDEATGSAAFQLTGQLGRELEIRQGRGSMIHARPLEDGRAEIAGRVVSDPHAQPR